MIKIKRLTILFFLITIIAITVALTLAYHQGKRTLEIGQEWRSSSFVITFGQQDFMFYGLMNSWEHSPNPYEGDTSDSIHFTVNVYPDGSIWLMDVGFRPLPPADRDDPLVLIGIKMMADSYIKGGNSINRSFAEAIEHPYAYSKAEGEQYGLKRYVEYRKDGLESSSLVEWYVTNHEKPQRLLQVRTPRHLLGTGKGGGVSHYFMYNDLVQVDMDYGKEDLPQWFHIETSVRQYIDQLYAEAAAWNAEHLNQ